MRHQQQSTVSCSLNAILKTVNTENTPITTDYQKDRKLRVGSCEYFQLKMKLDTCTGQLQYKSKHVILNAQI